MAIMELHNAHMYKEEIQVNEQILSSDVFGPVILNAGGFVCETISPTTTSSNG